MRVIALFSHVQRFMSGALGSGSSWLNKRKSESTSLQSFHLQPQETHYLHTTHTSSGLPASSAIGKTRKGSLMSRWVCLQAVLTSERRWRHASHCWNNPLTHSNKKVLLPETSQGQNFTSRSFCCKVNLWFRISWQSKEQLKCTQWTCVACCCMVANNCFLCLKSSCLYPHKKQKPQTLQATSTRRSFQVKAYNFCYIYTSQTGVLQCLGAL